MEKRTSTGANADGDERGPEPGVLERRVLPILREPTLWPVLLVVVGHAVAFVSPVLLFAFRDRRPPAAGAALLLLALSSAGIRLELREKGRPGPVSGVLVGTWVLAGVVAWSADHYGVF